MQKEMQFSGFTNNKMKKMGVEGDISTVWGCNSHLQFCLKTPSLMNAHLIR
jgi:hypothetical protein